MTKKDERVGYPLLMRFARLARVVVELKIAVLILRRLAPAARHALLER